MPPRKKDTKETAKKAPSKKAAAPRAAKKAGSADTLKHILAATGDLNKVAKKSLFKMASEEALSDVKIWIPTGCPTLDLLCGGGIPVGRISEFFGKKGGGKSTIVHQALIQCQKMGGIAVYLDTEKAAHRERLEHMGLDFDSLVLLEPDNIEDAFENLFRFIRKIRENPALEGKPILVAWDTIVYTPSRVELVEKKSPGHEIGDIKTDGMAKTQRAKVIRAYMSHLIDLIAKTQVAFVFVNHITDLIGATYPGAYSKPGGTATEFAASIQVLVKQDNSFKMMQGEEQIGNGIKFKLEKTRLSVPKREVTARLNWFSGIDVPLTILDYLKDRNLAAKEGMRYSIPTPGGMDEVFISSGDAGEEKFRAIYEESEPLREFLNGLIWADYEAVIPWKVKIEEVPSDEILATEEAIEVDLTV